MLLLPLHFGNYQNTFFFFFSWKGLDIKKPKPFCLTLNAPHQYLYLFEKIEVKLTIGGML